MCPLEPLFYGTLADESFVKSPNEPATLFTKRWYTELSGGEFMAIELL